MKANRLFLLLLSTAAVSALVSCTGQDGNDSNAPVSYPSSSMDASSSKDESIESVPASSQEETSLAPSSIEESISSEIATSVDLVATNSEHLTIKFLDAKGQEIAAANEGKTIYIQVVSTDATQYSVNTIKATYTTGYSASNTKDLKSSYDENTGLYSFYIPTGINGNIKVIVTELDDKKFENNEIVGQYIQMKFNGYKFTGASEFASDNQWDATPVEILANGQIMMNEESKNMITSIEDNVAKTDHYSDLYFGHNLLLTGDIDNTSGAIKTPFTNDYNHLFVKKQNVTDADSLYTNAALSFANNGNKYLFVQVWRDGQDYASLFYESVSKTYTLNPTFHFVNNETKVSADKGQFEVIIDEEIELAVGYKDEGGKGNRILMEGLYGEFHNNEDLITFLGNGYAMFNNVKYSVAESEGNYILNSNTRRLTISLDLEAKSYTIVNDEEIEAGEPFKGHTYRGSFYNPWDEETDYFFMTFDAVESTYYSCVGSNSNISMDNLPYLRYMNNSTNAYGIPEANSYTYDTASGELTTMMFDCANSAKEMKFTYSQDMDTFTCTVHYSSTMYATKNMVMSLVA